MSKWSHDCARDDQIVPEECLACQYERADRERDDLAANLLKSNTRNYDLGRERDDALRRLAVLQRGFEALQGLIDSGAQANAAAMQSLHDEMVGYKRERDEAQKEAVAWKDLANRRTEERDEFSAETARLQDWVRALEPANAMLGQLYQKMERERDEARAELREARTLMTHAGILQERAIRERDEARAADAATIDALGQMTERAYKAEEERDEARADLAACNTDRQEAIALLENVGGKRDEALQAVRRLVEGLENALNRSEIEELCESLWDPYEEARKLLGCPVQNFPGGFEGSHFHFSDFDPSRDTCDTCNDYAESHKIDEKKEND
jgi:DNA repair exonuclease SbcCD ATPase subunit